MGSVTFRTHIHLVTPCSQCLLDNLKRICLICVRCGKVQRLQHIRFSTHTSTTCNKHYQTREDRNEFFHALTSLQKWKIFLQMCRVHHIS